MPPIYFNGTLIPEDTANSIYFNGTSIEQVYFNGTLVYELATGNTVGVYYGGNATGTQNYVTRLDSSGAQVGSETTVATGRGYLAGAKIDVNAVYFGGREISSGSELKTVTRINSSGSLVGSESSAGSYDRYFLSGSSADSLYGVYFAGWDASTNAQSNVITRVDSSGSLVGSETSAGTAVEGPAGAPIDVYSVHHGGMNGAYPSFVDHNKTRRINTSGSLVGSETSVGTARRAHAGAESGSYGVYWGGNQNGTFINTVTRIDSSGALVGSETSVGTTTSANSGAGIADYAVFYAGSSSTGIVNTVVVINSSGSQVGSSTTVGTARSLLAGAGV
jgi:hypothetical protein